jgi:hypothetical protein
MWYAEKLLLIFVFIPFLHHSLAFTCPLNPLIPSMASRRALKRKAKDFDDAATNHTAFHNPSVRRLEFTVTADAGSARTTSTLGRMSSVPAKKANSPGATDHRG